MTGTDEPARSGVLTPDLSTLPLAGRRLWPELGSTPRQFVLYGGTALALRLGHRRSEDFDFFSSSGFNGARVLRETAYLAGASVADRDPGTLVCTVERGGPVQVSFSGELPSSRAGEPDTATGPGIRVASLFDLAATKAQAVQARAAARDYLDLDALVTLAGISLAQALGAAAAVFGASFNPLVTLKALSFFDDGDLALLPGEVRRRPLDAVRATDPDRLPEFEPQTGLLPGPEA